MIILPRATLVVLVVLLAVAVLASILTFDDGEVVRIVRSSWGRVA